MADRKDQADPKPAKGLFSYVFIAMVLGILVQIYMYRSSQGSPISYSDFLGRVESGVISDVVISSSKIMGQMKMPGVKEPVPFVTVPVKDDKLLDLLKRKNVAITGEPDASIWSSILSWLLPLLLIYYAFGMFGRRMGGAATGVLGLTKSKAKIFMEKNIQTTFADVAGVDEAKEELQEIVRFLQDPKKYTHLGGRAPKGILLVGPPGTGKTLLARALAGEAKVPFFSINGSEFVEMFVGLGAARVRDLFEQARKTAPCIMFIDEIDALGRSRAFGLFGSGASDEKEQTLNQLLAEMDGFDSSEGVIILAATNRAEILDAALLRAGRFDRQVLVNTPDRAGRLKILQVHSKKVKLDPSANLDNVAAMTPGFSGADLANLINEAALIAVRRGGEAVAEADLVHAMERIVGGIEQKSKLMHPDEKRRVAFHEMGHATVALGRTGTERVHKVSIIPRGLGALGYTLQRPTEDRYLMDYRELLQKLSVLLGGRAAEKIFFHDVSTGAADDLVKATDIARAMVTQYAMGENLGLATFEVPSSPYLKSPQRFSEKQNFSEKTAELIDQQIISILDRAFQMSMETIERNRKMVESGAERLLKIETLDEKEILDLWAKYGRPDRRASRKGA